jgi:SAM-dependent methyltransferase
VAIDAPRLVEDSDTVLLRSDGRRAYPVHDGVPLLLAPEALVPGHEPDRVDVTLPQYAEAYAERSFYDAVAETLTHADEGALAQTSAARVVAADPALRRAFPYPRSLWLDATYDCIAQDQAYRHLAPVREQRVLQLGGSGDTAVKLLAAGATEAWLLTPVLNEARFGRALAQEAGYGGRLHAVVGVGEELPFGDNSFDVAYSGGSLHHTVTDLSLPEIARTLAPGGRFAAWDPWRAALYRLGISVFGKRDRDAFCHPMTASRAAPLSVFRWSSVTQHGALTRYPLLALGRMGIGVTLRQAWRIMALDERVAAWFRPVRRQGGSVVFLGTK